MTAPQSDPDLDELMPDPAVEQALLEHDGPYTERLDLVLRGYASRPALGERAYVVEDGSCRYLPSFTTTTYGELRRRSVGLAAAWAQDDWVRVEPGEFVVTLGFAGVDYVTTVLALAYAHGIAVPLQMTLSKADLDRILVTVAPTAIAATVADLEAAAQLAVTHPTVRSVIAFDLDEQVREHRDALAAARHVIAQGRSSVCLVTIDELIARGDPTTWQPPVAAEGDERMAMLIHSSGSTGTPKGTVATEGYLKQRLWSLSGAARPLVRVGFAPLNHGMGLATVTSTLVRGGTCHFTTKADLSMLLEDFGLARPTDLIFFPRVLEMIHRQYLSEVARRTRTGVDVQAAQEAVRTDMRPLLGGRVRSALVGSASTAPELKRFMLETFDLQLIDTYGSTEAGIVIIAEHINRAVVIDYKLRDVPELGYHATDKPYPRGEFCVKTRLLDAAYYKQPEATGRLFDADGYLVTGDIMEQREPDHLVFVDRRNDVMKLSQGEYVAVGNLATAFESASNLIEQIYIYGTSARSYLVAVVVPNLDVARAELGADHDSGQLRALIRSELTRVGARAALRSFEIPRDFLVELEPFSPENGLLSSAHKRLRPALNERYGDQLEQLYAVGEQRQSEALVRLQDSGGALSTLEKVSRALALSLGVDAVDPAAEDGFADLGGDSLGAVSFADVIKDVFGVDLPVNAILSPAGNVTAWARAIDSALTSGDPRLATFDRVHGADATTVTAAQLEVSHFLDDEARAAAHAAKPARTEEPNVVLLTGATGFLGRFVCLEWLQRLSENGHGRLICLVRAPSQTAAEQRLTEAFASDPDLARHLAALASGRLEVIVGDIAEPDLGLEPAAFANLAGEVDRIVHVGALVNHMLGYRELFAPNVAGTGELVRLALADRITPIDFVSSLAVTHLVEGTTKSEDSSLLPQVPLTDSYGTGYATSKWASEQLLHSANEEYGLPVTIYRGDMMLAHRRYRGQINVPDTFTRLLLSVISTGLAPASFYALDSAGRRVPAHYDGLPVDFVAAAVVGLGATTTQGSLRTFHLTNPHEDGLSLDTFVDWIEGAGFAIHRIADYETWLRQFDAALRALPESLRRHSSLNLLESLARPATTGHSPAIGCEHFRTALASRHADADIPHLDHAFIVKCLADMKQLDLIAHDDLADVAVASAAPAPV